MADSSTSASGPLFVSSGDLIADRRYKWALDQAARGDFVAATEILAQTVELAPGFASAWFALGAIRDRLGDRAGAIAAFEQARDADAEDYHGARLQLARLGAGEATPAMTAVYVRRLFDQHAPQFEKAVIERLGYRGPELLFDAVIAACRASGREQHFDRALDLGCGTGLAGRMFARHVDSLVGVDLSPKMIEVAHATGVYNHLHAADMNEFLAHEKNGSADLVLAADAFPYVADLALAVREIARVLEDGGLFAFTVERQDGDGVVLQPTLRYAHSEAHVRTALARAALSVVTLEPASTRTENGVPVPGLVVVAAKPVSTASPSAANSGA
jgi:predicted TPR repeat methyltransferase